MSLTDEDGPMREIIGIVGNVKHQSLRREFTPEMYVPATQIPDELLLARGPDRHLDPTALTSAIRDALAQIDPGIPLTRVRVFEDYLTQSLARPRFNALLLSIFAGVALLLTAIGIYGVMAYSVAQRRQEIGIRMALGAQRGDVLRLVVGGGMKLTGLGVLIGITAVFALRGCSILCFTGRSIRSAHARRSGAPAQRNRISRLPPARAPRQRPRSHYCASS